MKKRLDWTILIVLVISIVAIFFVSFYSMDKKEISFSPLTLSIQGQELPAGSKNFFSTTNIISSQIKEVKFEFDGVNSTYYDDSLVLRYNFYNVPAIGESLKKVADISKYANAGTIIGPVSISNGRASFSYEGPIVLKYITVPDSNSLDLGTGDFSIGVWIVFPVGGSLNWEGIITKGYTTSAPAKSWGIARNVAGTDSIRFFDSATNGVWNANLYSGVLNETAHHIVVTRKATSYSRDSGATSTYSLYVDGVLSDSDLNKPAVDLTNTAPLLIGKDISDRYFQGTLGEIQIWKRALTEEEIKQLSAVSILKKNDADSWELYANKKNLAGGTYNYLTYVKNIDGTEASTEKQTLTISGGTSTNIPLAFRGSFHSQPGTCDNGSEASIISSNTIIGSTNSGTIKLISNESTIGFYVARDDCLPETEKSKWTCLSMGKDKGGSIKVGFGSTCSSNSPIVAVGLNNLKQNYNLKEGWIELCSDTGEAGIVVTYNGSVSTGKTCATIGSVPPSTAGGIPPQYHSIGRFNFSYSVTDYWEKSYNGAGVAEICVKDVVDNIIEIVNDTCDSCTDSDASLLYPNTILTKGTTANSTMTRTDACTNATMLAEYSCSGTIVTSSIIDCVQRGYAKCGDGKCMNESGVVSDLSCPSITAGGPRIPIKTRVNDTTARGVIKYCDPLTLNYTIVKAENAICSNDYECDSNSCLEGKCVKLRTEIRGQGNLLKEIWCWIQGIIPGDPTREQCRASYGLPD